MATPTAMARRRRGGRGHDERSNASFQRIAAQLGISRRVLQDDDDDDDEDDNATHAAAMTGRRPPSQNDSDAESVDAANDGHDARESRASESEGGDSELMMPETHSHSANESVSSDLSLPHSFDQPRRAFAALSQFDDRLQHALPGARTQPQGSAASNARGAVPAAVTTANDLMRKFYEAQVDKIRTQLAIATQNQRALQQTLEAERTNWNETREKMEEELTALQSRSQTEIAELRGNNEQLRARLALEKEHFGTLQISDALAEQLARQDEQDLSVREYVQLKLHQKVRPLENELENCRRELLSLQGLCETYKHQAKSASDDIAQATTVAGSREMRLRHELELAESTRRELEREIAAMCSQLETFKTSRTTEQSQALDARIRDELEHVQTQLTEKEITVAQLMAKLDAATADRSELIQRVDILQADKTFLLEAKEHLEVQLRAVQAERSDLQNKVESLTTTHEHNITQNTRLQDETRLMFEKKMEDEMNKLMELSKKEIESIRSNGQIVYERENRMLKDARDDAVKQLQTTQAKLHDVQTMLDEKILSIARLEAAHTTSAASLRNDLKMKHFELTQLTMTLEERSLELRNARQEVEMLEKKVQVVKEEFSRLESTSTARISQLEASLEAERKKLMEYEQLEVEMDSAVLQTGDIAVKPGANGQESVLTGAIDTLGAVPSATKRRFQQSVKLAQQVVQHQKQVMDLKFRHENAQATVIRLENQVAELKAQLETVQQPQTYLMHKLSHKDTELKRCQQRLQQAETSLSELRDEFHKLLEAKMAVQAQLQQLLTRRQDLDALKSTVHVLRQRLQTAPVSASLNNVDTANANASTHAISRAASPTSSPLTKVAPPAAIERLMTQPPQDSSVQPAWYTKLRS